MKGPREDAGDRNFFCKFPFEIFDSSLGSRSNNLTLSYSMRRHFLFFYLSCLIVRRDKTVPEEKTCRRDDQENGKFESNGLFLIFRSRIFQEGKMTHAAWRILHRWILLSKIGTVLVTFFHYSISMILFTRTPYYMPLAILNKISIDCVNIIFLSSYFYRYLLEYVLLGTTCVNVAPPGYI